MLDRRFLVGTYCLIFKCSGQFPLLAASQGWAASLVLVRRANQRIYQLQIQRLRAERAEGAYLNNRVKEKVTLSL